MSRLTYVSLFSGICAATAAWKPLGMEPLAFAEIEPFPVELLAQRYPGVPNLGDVSAVDWSPYRGKADVLVGGSPCQAFSVVRIYAPTPQGRMSMNKKKAIEAAISAGWEAYTSGVSSRTIAENIEILAEVVADRAYEAGKIKGRIAGLREAARWVAIERHDRSDGTNIMLRDLAKGIRAYANALAKKVRTPKSSPDHSGGSGLGGTGSGRPAGRPAGRTD